MSSDLDIDINRSMTLENELNTILIHSLNPKPRNFFVERSPRTISLFCLAVFIIYLKLFSQCISMMHQISTKGEYFDQQLLAERIEILRRKNEFNEFFDDFKSNWHKQNKSCQQCQTLFHQLNRKHILRLIDKNQPIKNEYDDILWPLHYLLVLLCLTNNFLVLFVFEKALKFYIFSNILLIISVGIYAELFIEQRPNVHYILVIAGLINLFTISLLFQAFNNLLAVRHYQKWKTSRK